MLKRIIIVSGIIITTLGIYYLSMYFLVDSEFGHDNLPNDLIFDMKTWQNGTPRQRGQMVNYLTDSIGIIGKTKAEIRKITGNPDNEYETENEEYKSRFCYVIDKGHVFNYNMIIFFDSTDHAKFILFDD